MNPRAKKGITFVIRWGIAVAGIWWVLANISLHDRVMVLNPQTKRPVPVRLAAPASESSVEYRIYSPFSGSPGSVATIGRDELFVKSDRDLVEIREPDGSTHRVEILGLKVSDQLPREQWPLLVARPRTIWMKYSGSNWGDVPQMIEPSRIAPSSHYSISVPYPIIETGLGPMVAQAFSNKPLYLILAVIVFPIAIIITSFRWHMLLKILDIQMSLSRTFIINMVGAFYNTFMPGSTGGDVLKAYYASKQTQHRTRAVISVIVDRILGLLALVVLGGTMAAVQFFLSHEHDAVRRKCGQVALGSVAIIGTTLIGLFVFFNPVLRRITGLDFIIRRLPMQKQVQTAIETMELYRQHWIAVLWSVIMTLPVHGTVVVSATFAGLAFGLPMHPAYYWVAVPVIVLAGSIPISPQGAGVMEFFAILLTRAQGVTVSQAFALTMSIRCVQIFWNLTGGIFVIRGGFHAPTSAERHEMDVDLGDRASGQVPGPEPA